MKKIVVFLSVILSAFCSFGQGDCAQGDGTFRYSVKLSLENVSADFDKDNFLNLITNLDTVSNEDLITLNTHIIAVYKIAPTAPPTSIITNIVYIDTTIEIWPILDNLNNSIQAFYCVSNDCTRSDGTFGYYATLISDDLPSDYNKADFINHITSLDAISNNDLAILTGTITSVSKAFLSSLNPWLERIVVIEGTTEIYSILDNLDNSIEYHSCFDDDYVLSVANMSVAESLVLYPNPITKNSVIKLNKKTAAVRLSVFNSIGQTIYRKKYYDKDFIEVNTLALKSGIYFIKITDLTNQTTQTLKAIKN